MAEAVHRFFSSNGFMPHGMCYLWKPELMWLHAISDGIIALSYYAIPVGLVVLVARRRGDLPFHWMFLVFALFLVACGTTHLMGIWNLWHPDYWLSGGVKVVTAIASLGTAALLIPLLPKALAVKSPFELDRMNTALEREIAERRRLETLLAEAESIAHLGSWEWHIQENKVRWSDEMYRIFGLSPGERMSYERFLEGVHPDDRIELARIVEEAVYERTTYVADHRIVRPDGEIRFLHAEGRVVRDPTGGPVRMYGTGQDVTERTIADRALRESEERFRMLAENASDVISRSDASGATTYISPAVWPLLGYEPEALVGRGFLDLVHPDDLPAFEEAQRSSTDPAEPIWLTFRICHKDGHYLWVESAARRVQSESGENQGFVTVIREVTEGVERSRFRELVHRVTTVANQARLAEDALAAALREICRFKEWPLAHAYVPADDGSGELAPARIWYPAEPSGYESFRQLTETMRFEPGEGLPGRVQASGEPAWIPDVTRDENFPRAAAAAKHGLAAAFGFPARSGEEVVAVLEFFTTDVLPPEPRFLDALDEIGAQLGEVIRRQETEATLRKRESQLAEAQAIAHIGNWEMEVESGRVTLSDELCRIYGREPSSTDIGNEEFLGCVHAHDRPFVERSMREALETALPFEYEYRLVRPDGSVRIAHSHGRAELDTTGRVIRLYGVSQDITRRKAAEEALRESEHRYRFLAEYATDMITVFSPQGTCTFASPAARSILGYASGELLGRQASDFIHPDDLDRVAETRLAILHSFATRSLVCRLRRRTGGWIWAETTIRGVRDPATGMVESIVAVTRDVTQRVRSERAMRLLQRVAAAANEATSVESAVKAALQAVCEHTGWVMGHAYVPSEALGGELTPADIWHLDTPERFEEFRLITQQTPLAIGQGLPGHVLATGRAQWITDLANDEGFLRKREAEILGLRSAFAFPIKAGDETLAVLEFFSTETVVPDPQLAQAVENVGVQLGQVVRRHRVEAALKASEVRFRALAETANDAIVTIDEEGRIVYTNRAVSRIFGHDGDDLIGQGLEMLMPERYRAELRQGLQRYLETGQSRIVGESVELTGLRRDGHEVPIDLSIAAWSAGDRAYFTGIVRDITARKMAEQILTEKMEELSRSNAELALFSYVASHDLREPLRTVASNVQLLERRLGDNPDEDIRRSIRFARDGSHRMQALIDDLLAYSRVGTEGREFESVDSGELLDDVVASLRAAIDAEAGEVERSELPVVWADRSQLAQVFQNLISNAVKFHDDQPPRVRVSAERREDQWVFSVRDEGIGFDPQFAESVFTIFQRLHPAEEYAGTGIGLAICRKIVERHGGRIWAESEPGKGSVFRFTIPALD